jgi:inner membrane protein
VASLPSHAIAALGIGALFYKPDTPKRVWVVGAACSVFPDLDVIGFRFGIRYDTVIIGDTEASLTPFFLLLFSRVPSCSWDFEAHCRISAVYQCGHTSFWRPPATVCWML